MNARITTATRTIGATLLALFVLAPNHPSAQAGQEKYRGFTINTNQGGARTSTAEFAIDKWTSDEDREKLLSIITEFKDPTAPLLKALQDQESIGYIRTTDTLRWELRYAHQSPLPDGGRRVVIATDRPIGFAESRYNARTMEYPFTIVEIHFDKSGEGEGKILAGTKIYVENKVLQLENYGLQPIRFNKIKKVD